MLYMLLTALVIGVIIWLIMVSAIKIVAGWVLPRETFVRLGTVVGKVSTRIDGCMVGLFKICVVAAALFIIWVFGLFGYAIFHPSR
jgi:hypothetical protein